MIKDKFYEQACRDAKEDFFMCGVQRTDEEVKINAEKLRKQVPDKPYFLIYFGTCGNWNHGLACIVPEKDMEYCPNCGQKLDWSDVK